MKNRLILAFILVGLNLVAEESFDCCPATEISFPCYTGGFHLEGSWIYLRPTPTDADLEYGSFLTLTTSPANLNALLLEVEPSHQSGYDLSLGYFFPHSNQSVHANYFSFQSCGKDSKKISSENQLIQNFLGASYSTARAESEHKIDQAAVSYRFDSLIDQELSVNVSFGVAYSNICRDFCVNYSDLVLNPTPSELSGKERSRYWGVGPLIGMEFAFPLLCHFGIEGGLETGVFFGENCSRLSSDSFRDNFREQSFFSKNTSHPIVTNINCDLGLVYSYPVTCNWGIEFKVGYQVHYYFKPINRINPFNGFVNNPDLIPVAVDRPSNLGLGGPYVVVSLSQALFPCFSGPTWCCSLSDKWVSSGPDFEFTSFWLKPRPTNDDLVYATLAATSGKQKDLKTDPDLTWAGKYKLGYRFCPSMDLSLSAFFFESSDRVENTTAPGETISSVNASGPSGVTFAQSTSRVQYKFDQYEGSFGKSMQLCDWLNLHGGVGLRFLKQERILTNGYAGGTPPLITQAMFPELKSRYKGIGPLFTFEPTIGLLCNFEMVGNLRLAFLVGEAIATLDQENFGLLGFSSNDLRTPKTPHIAPIFEGSAGISWNSHLFSCAHIGITGGYEYQAYYRTVRLLLPTLLTGLEQINSNLILQGPYLRGELSVNF